jgi:hypothetical protein
MCPKGDDPLMANQGDRSFKMIVTSSSILLGFLEVEFQGRYSLFSLSHPSAEDCVEALQNSRSFGTVGCGFNKVSNNTYIYNVTVFSWPIYPVENNIYFHNGNPALSFFSCRSSLPNSFVNCTFEDISTPNIKGIIVFI